MQIGSFNRHRRLVRAAGRASVAFGALLVSWESSAQTAPPEQPVAQAEDIVVTGSRIHRPETEGPSPIVAYDAATLVASGKTDITDFLISSPALVNSTSSAQDDTGKSNLNLRGLGVNRTLVLVNGRRHVAGDSDSAAVDINTIPTDLVERVDIVTGGASAVYGADAVSGVVNFILKRNYSGLSARIQNGISQQGDAGQRFGSIIAGHNFADGRGNVAVSVEYAADDPLFNEDRSYRSQANGYYNFDPNVHAQPGNPTVPDYIPLKDDRVNNGALSGGYDTGSTDAAGVYHAGVFDGIADFTGNGAVFDHGTNNLGYETSGGNGTPNTYVYAHQLQTKQRRLNVNLLSHFEVSPALEFYGEAKYAQSKTARVFYTTYDIGNYISPDNPFIPQAIRNAIDPTRGFYLTERDNLDLGFTSADVTRETLRGVAGARGKLSDWLSYDASYVYGQTTVVRTISPDRYQDRYLAAIDVITDPATGQPTCRSNLFPATAVATGSRLTFTPGPNSGCVPYNIFGDDVASAAAKQWATFSSQIRQKITQQVADVDFTGTFDPILRPAAGSIGFSLGAEYRRESIGVSPDQNVVDGVGFADFGAGTQPQRGAFDVKEVFGELSIPLLAKRPFVDKLILSLAGRYSDYSTSGGNATWNVDLVYGPVRGLTFRGTLSKAVRAPNLIEEFAAPSASRVFVNDPCDISNLNNGTASRVANCKTLLTSLGANQATFTPTVTQIGLPITATTSGNKNLRPETANTWTAGVVFDRIRNLYVSLDWYDVRLKGAIETIDPISLCVDAPSLNNVYCGLINRQNGGPFAGYVTTYQITPINIASYSTSGADLTVNYTLKTDGFGRLNAHVVAGYLNRLTFNSTADGAPTENAGQAHAPKYTADVNLSWMLGTFTLNYQISWWSKTATVDQRTLAADPNYYAAQYLYVPQRWLHDASVSIDIDKHLQLYGGVNNILNQKPFITSLQYPESTSLYAYPVSDVGRFLFVGAKVKL